jgi:Domain of unknown function (DUF4129)
MILRRAPWLILCATILAMASPSGFCQAANVPSSPQTLSLQAYIAEVDHCSAVVNNPRIDRAAVHELRVSLPTSWTVKAGGQNFDVSTDWLADGLATIESDPRGSDETLEQVRQRLATYRKSAQAFEMPDSTSSVQDSRAKLNKIFSTGEFQSVQAPSWLEVQRARLYAWIIRQLAKLLGRMGRPRSIGNVIAWIVIALASLLLLLWAARATIRAGKRPEMDLRGAAALGRDWHHWLREAREAAGRGDYRSAIHAAYWAAVARLEETNSLPEDRSRTPRESLRLVRKESAEYAPLSQLTRRFELVWYGYRSATPADWNEAMQQLEILGCLRASTPAISGS